MTNMEKQNAKEHKALFGLVKEMSTDLKSFFSISDKKYSTKEDNQKEKELQVEKDKKFQMQLDLHSKLIDKLQSFLVKVWWAVIIWAAWFIWNMIVNYVTK